MIPPAIEKALEQLTLDERRALWAEARQLLNHPDARFERSELEDRFVTYRAGPTATQTVSVPVPSHLLIEAAIARDAARRSRAGSLRETDCLDKLQKAILVKLVELLHG